MELIPSNTPLETAGGMLDGLLRTCADREILLLVSGGSAFSILEYISDEVFGPHLTIGMCDERYSDDPLINNFKQLQQLSFFRKAESADANIIVSSIQEGESRDGMAARIDAILKEWFHDNQDEIVITLCGIGADGHTAGIMPFPENKVLFSALFEDPTVYVRGYNAAYKNQYAERVTVTASFFRTKVDHAMVFATGEAKANALRRTLQDDGCLNETPARLFREIKQAVLVSDLDKAVLK